MKKLFFLIVILLAAIGFGFLIHKDPGYVMVSFNHWMIATSLWVAIAAIILAFVLLYFFIRLFKNIASIPRALRQRKLLSNAEDYQRIIEKGIMSIAVGDFDKAEKYFLKCDHLNHSAVNFLLAAQAANAQRAFDRRDAYLKKALAAADEETGFAITLSQAQFYLQSDQMDEALVILKRLLIESPKNPLILSALKMIYFRTHQWELLKLLLPQLKKQQLISSQEIEQIR